MVGSTTGEAAPRYAPSDPSLPAPWKALVDGKTGYIYYWNTETNITQYEKPFPSEGPPPLPEGHHPGSAVASSVVKSSVIPNGLMGGNGMNDMQNQRPVNSIPGNSNQSRSGGNYNGGSTENNISGGGGGSYNGQPQHARSGGFNSSQHGHSDRNGGRSDSGSMCNNTGPMHGSSPMPGHPKMGAPHMGRMGGNNLGNSGQGNFHSVLGNIHGNMSGNAAGEPKLASIPEPRSQQGMGPPIRMHPQVAPVHTNGAGSMSRVQSGNVSVMNMKPSPNIGFGQDPYKRSQPAAIMDVDAYRRQHEVTVSGDNVPPPFMTFDSTGFPPELMKELQSAGFLAPTPIQAQSWPVALQSRDVVAIAKTGSGKTLGYLVPAFLHLARACCDSRLGPSVLVLAPTRELATQIQDEAVKFGRSSRFSTTCVYGGAPKGPQLRDLERGADIVIATPGRLNDFLEVRKVSLRQVTYLVLDEADRMLDMGFEPQIRKIVKEIPARRQTLMYTATWPKEVREIAHDLLVNPVQVNIGNSDVLSANKAITQNVEFVPPFEKQRRLEQILRGQDPGARIIIFCSTKKMCDTLARNLGRSFRAAVIHGDKSQGERDHVLAQFKQGRSPVLVATDVAARGLDIKDIRVVINYDFPTGVEDYVHRIGRTGRAGATGISYTFFSEQDGKHAKSLVKVLEDANQKVPMELRDMAGRSSHMKPRFGRYDTGGRGGRDSGRSSSFGGRGDSFGMGGGGRGLGMGGGGMWGGGGGGIQDKPFGRPGNRDRFDSRDGGHERLPPDDRYNRGRDMNRRVGGGGGGGRDRAGSRSNSRSRSRSPSRSRSYDRYSTDPHQKLSSPQARRQVIRNGSPRAGGGMPYPSGLSGAGLSGPPVDLAGPIPPKLE